MKYVYDTESTLYYLQSRYYDPEMGRFISADVYTSTGQGLLGNNMFAYCLNNPACRIEIGGYASEEADLDDQTKDELFHQPIGGGNGTGFDPYQAALDNRSVPNPYGRHGGMSHRELVNALRMLFNELGFDVSPNEKRVLIPESGNTYRYPDLTVDTGCETIYVQVGKSTLSGDPIAREQRAIDDLRKTGNQVWFFCYDD